MITWIISALIPVVIFIIIQVLSWLEQTHEELLQIGFILITIISLWLLFTVLLHPFVGEVLKWIK